MKKLRVELKNHRLGWSHAGYPAWEASYTTDHIVFSVGDYARKDSCKRGMIRFLKSIGADSDCIEWVEV